MSVTMDLAHSTHPLLPLSRSVLYKNPGNLRVTKPALERAQGISSQVFNNVLSATVSIKDSMKTTFPRKSQVFPKNGFVKV